jgi:ribonuclease HII
MSTRSNPAKSRNKPRLRLLSAQQIALQFDEPGLVAGVDEAGRGPLAGPVVAAAVMLNPAKPIKGVGDSKTISPRKRIELFQTICEQAVCVSVGHASVAEIDELNILQATLLAMQRAVAGLRIKPALVLVDGNRLPKLDIRSEAIVKGDARVQSIGAASIIAKVTRDELMEEADTLHPGYGFAAHKGYGTAQHLEALQRLGPTPWHRRSFAPVTLALARHSGS